MLSARESHRLSKNYHISLEDLSGETLIVPFADEVFCSFSAMRQLFVDIKEKVLDNQSDMVCLSMGMSGSYEAAILEGATLVRVGTAIYGERDYPNRV